MKTTINLSLILQFFLLAAVFLFVASPALHDGLFNVYDNVQVTRSMAVYAELNSGQFPVRFFGTFGHGAGYFLMKYYSPLIYYLAALVHVAGFSFIQAIKLIYLFFIAIGAIGTWVLLRSLTGRVSSTLGTLAFLLAPYLYHDFYHRGSLTEASAFMLLPWVIWSFFQLKKVNSYRYLGLSALTLGVTLLTHSLTGLMAVPLVFLFLGLRPRTAKVSVKLVLAVLLGFGLAAFSFLPAFVDKGLVNYTGNSLVQRGYLDQPVLFWSQLTARGDTDIKTAFLGLPLFLAFFALLSLMLKPAFRHRYGPLGSWVLLVMTTGLFLMSPASSWLWARLESLRYTQFPFRFLTIVTTAGVVGYTLVSEYFQKSKLIIALLAALILVQILIYPHFYEPLGYQYGTVYKVEDPCMTTGWADEHLPVWVQKCLKAPLPSLVTPISTVQVSHIQEKDNGRTVTFDLNGHGSVMIGKYYFPNWRAVNERGESFKLEPYGENGLIKLAYLGPAASFTVSYRETPLEKFSDWLSLVSLLLVLYTLRYGYRH